MTNISVVEPLRVMDHDVAGPARLGDLALHSAPMTKMLTQELEEAQLYLQVTLDELLIAALGRAIGKTIGDGEVLVEVHGHAGLISLMCSTARDADATEMLRAAHRKLAAVTETADDAAPACDVFFSYIGSVAEPSMCGLPPAEMVSNRGHAIALRVYRTGGLCHTDWWYDARRLDEGTIDELAEQLPLAVIEVTSEAMPPGHSDSHVAIA
jgi:hypothetical protein